MPAGRLRALQLGQLAALVACLFLLFRFNQPAPDAHAGHDHDHDHDHDSEVTVTPGDTTVERGSSLIVLARFAGEVPADATLVIGAFPEAGRRLPLTRNLADPVFGGSLPEVGSNLTYRVEYTGGHSRDFKITVFDYPALQRSDAHIVYPDYTGLPEKRVPETRRVSAVEGSKLDFTLQL